ncbi:UDP-N-acetylglucosamine 2-epimerase (non-hydrolyzing) [Blautia schinkii]|nr:UDP-N-acetylglucosamine 2-epimerase (non-hydrolyzing) [Blautia schinkii]
MKKIAVVFGTRPEAIKMCPLVLELKSRQQVQTIVCVTGQHREMLDSVLKVFDVEPDYDLDIMKEEQTLFDVTILVMTRMKAVLEKERPDVVLVHGDTTTAYAAALACFYLRIPVGHVEAGLRTYDIFSPYPEEMNRRSIGIMASYHFAPTQAAGENLLREGVAPGRIFITGNTAIDAMKTTVRQDYTHAELEWAKGFRCILITAHRRENLGKPMEHMFRAIRRIVDEFADVKVIYPVHLNPAVQEYAKKYLGDSDRIHLIKPLDVIEFHNLMARCYLVLTDSGGIQEEAPGLGKPVLVMRDTTERPEGVAAGTLKLAGTEEEHIYQAFRQLLTDKEEYEKMSRASNPYGDGRASIRIADILEHS